MNSPPRVLHLFDFYLPSTLSWVARLLDSINDVDIEIGAPWIVRNQFYHPHFRYHIFPPQRFLSSPPGSEFEAPGWKRILLGSQHLLPTYRWWLAWQLRQQPPDLLHAHFGPMGCLYLPLAQRLERPLIVTFYGFDYTKLPTLQPAFRQRYRTLFTQAAQVIGASAVGCERLVELGCPPEKLAVVPPSPRLTDFPLQNRHKEAGQLQLVQIATFTPKKGHLTTLSALRLAVQHCPNLHLTLAGERVDPELVQRIKRYIQDHQLAPHITWLDFVDHRQLAEFLGQFDVFIHPSCHAPDGDHEDTPVVILEAQATGLPVVATTHFNLPAAVAHEVSGLLAPEGDAEVLAQYIERFYWMENEEYQTFSQHAHQHVVHNFDVRNAAVMLSGLYQKHIK